METFRIRHLLGFKPKILLVIWLLTLLHSTHGWHDFTSNDFHCWPLTASANAPTSYTQCTGVELEWITPPPEEIKAQEPFSLTYRLTLTDEYYDWAVKDNTDPLISDPLKGNFFAYLGYTTAAEAKNWCRNTACPTAAEDVFKENCCIHHVNVHSCPLADSAYCGPWIKPAGDTYTHSAVLWGKGDQTTWDSTVDGIYIEGNNQLIAHFKVADMQIAIRFDMNILPRSECGNDICEEEDDEDCSTCPADCGNCPLAIWQIALIAVAGVLIVGAIIAVVVYFQVQQRKMLWDESWIIPYDELKEDNVKRGFMGSVVSINRDAQSDTKSITRSMGDGNKLAENAAAKQKFTTTSMYNGKTVAVKAIPKKQFSLTKSVRVEVKHMRELDHVNILKLVGCCIEVPHVTIAVEYCPKGSLEDVLLNEDVPLNWGFRFSFASDIANGMKYMHAAKMSHGNLKSSNCVIDDRWTLKITDYGIPTIRRVDKDLYDGEDDNDDEYYKARKSRIYHAPETYDVKNFTPTPAADVYAYSIILIEIAIRDDPYQDHYSDDLEDKWKPPLPEFKADEAADTKCPCPTQYLKLIKDCWANDSKDRPSFGAIRGTIQKINPNKQSPVDLMMAMMEKYSKHLEEIVGERTEELREEKKKTLQLLHMMLPEEVATALTNNIPVSPEQFDQCTIYFSDIVGFTNLSGSSTPFQVVDLLNDLYTVFDTIIDKYQVYKVETIGDAYMVVSGVPKQLVNIHAREISHMSIDLVEACEVFKIRHKPGEKLKIRVGMHSGSVCAGVVGLKMPRYCLFGDTVNTASRMESNGEAYKIHMSSYTYDYLQKCGGFICEKRGTIPIKGKGEMTTYWLKGRDTPPKTAESEKKEPPQPDRSVTAGEITLVNDDKLRKESRNSDDSGYKETVEEAAEESGETKDDKNMTPVNT